MTTLNATQVAGAFLAIARANAALLPPNAQLALALADGALAAINAVQGTGKDITDEQLTKLISLDAIARADDRAAQRELLASRVDSPKGTWVSGDPNPPNPVP